MRALVAGLLHESNTFANTFADKPRFEAGSLHFGADLIPVWKEAHHELGGFIQGAQEHGLDLIPSVAAIATPSGPVDDLFLEEILQRIETDLRIHPVDGVLLALHGAMVTPLHLAADEYVLHRIREMIGPQKPLIVTLDFHANCSSGMAEAANAILGYQTYPHIDQRDIGRQAAQLMAQSLRQEIQPVTYVAKRPMIANILGQATDREPMKSLMTAARGVERLPGMLSVSVMGGFYYADVPQMGPSVLAVADGNRDLAREQAEAIAEQMWIVREQLDVACRSPQQAVAEAIRQTAGPVLLVDLGDNIGGGSAGDGTVLLRELLQQQAGGAIVVLYAPESVQECQQVGLGGRFQGKVGGKVDHLHGDPVDVKGIVRCLHDGQWLETEARHGGKRQNNQGPTAVVDLEGGITLVLNSLQTPPFSLGQLTSLGLHPETASIIVVKAAVAYKAAYAPIAHMIIEVDTPGITAVNPKHFKYERWLAKGEG